jgi:lysophospholipid acyltransferase (LPLAT)-like uncharacterized protein
MLYKIQSWLLLSAFRLIGPSLRLIGTPFAEFDIQRSQGKYTLFCIWHEVNGAGFIYYRDRGAGALIEASAKGDLLAAVANHYGIKDFRITDNPKDMQTVKGTIQFLKYLKAGHDGTIAIDGPNGPYHIIKPGIFALAQKTGHTIRPAGVWYSRKFTWYWRWDKYQMPLPFSKVYIYIDKPFSLPETLDESTLNPLTARLKETLDFCMAEAERLGEAYSKNDR